jgi:hypothetical protein
MGRWESSNKHAVAVDLEEGKSKRRYKECTHLRIGENTNPYSSGERFFLHCEEDSLLLPEDPSLAGIVGMPLLREPCCPDDCRFFEDRAKAEAEKQAAEQRAADERAAVEKRAAEERAQAERVRMAAERRARTLAVVRWPIRTAWALILWYGKAPWQTQVFLAFALLVILTPVYAKALAELLKAALHGK